MGLIGRIVVAVGTIALVGMALAHAQGMPTDGPTAVVTMPSTPPADNWGTLGDLSWPVAAYGVVHRFLAIFERVVTDTRAWLDRVLDVTKGRLKIDFRKTVVSTFAEQDPDRTGPIPVQHNRRKTDRNGTSPDIEDDEDH